MNSKFSDGKLIIEVPVKSYKDSELSKSGKSKIMYSTRGFNRINNDVSVSLNVIYSIKD